MKKRLFTLVLLLTPMLHGASAQNPQHDTTMNKKILVAYFSATGTTARVAERLARQSGGDLFRIDPGRLLNRSDEATLRNWLEQLSLR